MPRCCVEETLKNVSVQFGQGKVTKFESLSRQSRRKHWVSFSANNKTTRPSKKLALKAASFIFKSKNGFSEECSSSGLIAQLDALTLDRKKPVVNTSLNLLQIQSNCLNSNVCVNKQHDISRLSLQVCKEPSAASLIEGASVEKEIVKVQSFEEMPSFYSVKKLNQLPVKKQKKLKVDANKHREFNRWQKEKTIVAVSKKETTLPPPSIASRSCSFEAHLSETNVAVNELAAYIENYFVLPKKMSSMAEMMYM